MATQRYSVTPQSIETLLAWVKSGDIAVPEIQRPFVWDATKVRNLLDSLYQGRWAISSLGRIHPYGLRTVPSLQASVS